MTKYVFVTGGVLSSLGKGIAAASIGALLKTKGVNVSIQKMDPYVNVDPGTMSPFQHGEVFVTDDGAETDLDLGHYERFTGQSATEGHSISTGKIYLNVIEKERRGDYLGKTVQVIPHITDEIKFRIKKVGKNSDVAIVEIGGTVGDIESLPFLEAIRQFANEVGHNNAIFVHLTYVPYIKAAKELKSKPTQHTVKELRSIGIQPDIILCRAEEPVPQEIKDKISLFCNVPTDCVFSAPDMDTIYRVPHAFHAENLDDKVCEKLELELPQTNLQEWDNLLNHIDNPKDVVDIAVVGKYVQYPDSYKSVAEALLHAGFFNQLKVNIHWIESESLEDKYGFDVIKNCHGVLVPGGFGIRGIEGMVKAITHCRENDMPFFGICLGMQLATIEFSRNVAKLPHANSSEFVEDPKDQIFSKLQELKGVEEMGGTMRLGSYPCVLTEGSKAYSVYGENKINERHRHRYEFNTSYRELLEDKGLRFSGFSPDDVFAEIVELENHPWFVGCQFHPEFKSQPLKPHPLFSGFIAKSHEFKLNETKEDNATV